MIGSENMIAFLELMFFAVVAIALFIAGRAKKGKGASPAPHKTMRCPSCGSTADVRGGHWECPYCGDSGSV